MHLVIPKPDHRKCRTCPQKLFQSTLDPSLVNATTCSRNLNTETHAINHQTLGRQDCTATRRRSDTIKRSKFFNDVGILQNRALQVAKMNCLDTSHQTSRADHPTLALMSPLWVSSSLPAAGCPESGVREFCSLVTTPPPLIADVSSRLSIWLLRLAGCPLT